MNAKPMIVFLTAKENRYSLNALLGSLESRNIISEVDVSIIDYRDVHSGRLEAIRGTDERVIFAFSFATPQYFEICSVVESLRSRFRNSIFIAGGPHPSGMMEQTFEMKFDHVFVGEAEETFSSFIEDFSKGRISILWRGKNVHRGDSPVELDNFKPFSEKLRRFGPIEITRGCPHRCYYCQTPSLFGRKVRHRSVDYICELVKIMFRYGLSDIRFISPDAFSYGSENGKEIQLNKICSLLENVRKILGNKGRIFFGSFPSEVRPERVTHETVALVKEFCDNDNLVIGAQSGSQRILDLIKREHTVEDVYTAVEVIVKNGLKANVDFIFGLPFEEDDDVFETIKFIRKLIKLGARIHVHYFMPLPGTPLARYKPKNFLVYEEFLKKELLPYGHAFGQWEKQKRLSMLLFDLINRKKK